MYTWYKLHAQRWIVCTAAARVADECVFFALCSTGMKWQFSVWSCCTRLLCIIMSSTSNHNNGNRSQWKTTFVQCKTIVFVWVCLRACVWVCMCIVYLCDAHYNFTISSLLKSLKFCSKFRVSFTIIMW